MNEREHINSDDLLKAIEREEQKRQRGKLKIFFGMSAGVGKTYSMLENARILVKNNIDIVIGYIETHGREETGKLLEGLTIIPRKLYEYHNTIMEEMDIDAILERKPKIILVDELAHTNAPGARHLKRYQDVLELLDNGIDVFTTVNVQHLESRIDTVREITGIMVRETIPDSIFEMADEIELIDITPEDLLIRLNEGKVYFPERAQLASRNFFRMGNLIALRELALRLTAERTSHQLQDYRIIKQIRGSWKTNYKFLVAVSPSPSSENLIRYTRRIAYSLNAPWIAVYVETSDQLHDEEKTKLQNHLSLAKALGAEVITTFDENVYNGLLRIARQQNVSQIIIGKTGMSSFRQLVRGKTTLSNLLKQSSDIDINFVRSEELKSPRRNILNIPKTQSSIKQYFLVFSILVSVALLNLISLPFIGYWAVGISFLFIISIMGIFFGRGPILMAATLSALIWNFIFIPPKFTLYISKIEDVMMFFMYFITALVSGIFTTRLRSQEKAVRHREEQISSLYVLLKEIASAITVDEVLQTAIEQISKVFSAEVAIILSDQSKTLNHKPHPSSILKQNENEYSVAAWVFNNNKTAGRFTDTLSGAYAQYLPLNAHSGVVGVLGIRTKSNNQPSIDQKTLLDAFVTQVALVIERAQLTGKKNVEHE
jgi:two-component system, OmpR family, sensor histidine kinase KdpD